MQKKLFILFLLLYCVVCYSAETTYYVDVDVIGGDADGSSLANAYSSLNLAETARDGNITAGDAVRFLCHNTLGGADTAAVVFNGWTTDADSYIKVEAEASYRHAGVYDTSKYHLTNTDAHIIIIQEDYVRLVGLQTGLTITADNVFDSIIVSAANAATDRRISDTIVTGISMTGNGSSNGIRINDSDSLVSIWNCVISNIKSASNPADTGFRGIFVSDCNTVNIWNCTINNCSRGITRNAGTANVVNCLVFENADDFEGTFNSVTYTASDDNDEAGAGNFQITQTADGYAALVVDAHGDDNGRDYNVTDGSSELVGTGTDDPGGVIQDDTDIAGTARTSTWDIGAFEFEGEEPPPTGGQVIMITSAIPVILILAICLTIGRIKHEPTQVNDV